RGILADAGLPGYTAAHVELLGAETLYGAQARTGASREAMVRIVVDHPMKKALEIFAREIAPSGTSWSPGTTMPAGGRPSPSPLIRRTRLRGVAMSPRRGPDGVLRQVDFAHQVAADPVDGAGLH